MSRQLAIIGAPTSAGAFAPGQEQAPGALRAAGLLELFTEAGLAVADLGDGPLWRWRPDRGSRSAQNLEAVVENARDVEIRVRRAVDARQMPLVLGGDCTVEVGCVAGHLPFEGRLGLLYFDLHPDLNVPSSVREGALDWMGMAHILGVEGAAEPLSRFGPRFPLLAPEDVYFFSYGPEQATTWEREVMKQRGLRGIPVEEVTADPEGAATRALAEFASDVDRLLIHFDVDVIDFTDAPLSENTGRNEGLSFEVAMRALRVLLRSEHLAGLTVTELNPLHGDEDGMTIRRFADALVTAISAAPVLRSSVARQ